MRLNKNSASLKYFYIEILFFVVFFIVFPIFSDLEYELDESHLNQNFVSDIWSRILYGTFDILIFLVFYKIIKQYLYKKKSVHFFVASILFLVIYNFYLKSIYFFIDHSKIFPREMAIKAQQYSHNHITFSVVYMLMIFLCITALVYYIRSAKQEEELSELKELHFLAELNYLKAQIHPHFFFNTLNNIYGLALKSSTDTAPMVAKLSAMMRYILYETKNPKVNLLEEINFLNDYVAIEKIRHSDQIEIFFDIQGVSKNLFIEPLLLLPFIENAFKHGIEEETGEGFVNIILCISEKELTLQVLNSKPLQIIQTTKGIGLENVKKRLELLYPERFSLDVQEKDCQYRLNLTLVNI